MLLLSRRKSDQEITERLNDEINEMHNLAERSAFFPLRSRNQSASAFLDRHFLFGAGQKNILNFLVLHRKGEAPLNRFEQCRVLTDRELAAEVASDRFFRRQTLQALIVLWVWCCEMHGKSFCRTASLGHTGLPF